MFVRERRKPVDELLARHTDAMTQKAQYSPVLQEIGKYIMPAAQDIVSTYPTSQGQVRTVNTYTSMPAMACYRMGAGVFAYLMPVGQHWFIARADDEELNERTDIKRWLGEYRVQVHQALWDSNFQREMFACIRTLCAFGTACLSVMWDGGLVFENHHMRDIAFEVNHRGEIDTVFKTKWMNVRQAEQMFGEGKALGKSIDEERQNNPYSNKQFEFIHCVYPNSKHDRFKVGSFPFVSAWVNKSDRKVVKVGGYYEQPYIVVRFFTVPGEIYGRSPSHDLLPEIKMYDRMRRTFIESAERAQNPPWWLTSESVMGQPITSPGALIYGHPGSQPPQPIITGVNAQLNDASLAQVEDIIQRGYFNDLFDVLAQYRNMTATEVTARIEEKMVLLSPAINGQKGELTDPVIARSGNLLMRHGYLRAKPKNLKTNIIYTGRLAIAMGIMQSNALGIVMSKWAPYQQVHPVYDNVDLDRAFREDLRAHGVSEKVFMDEDRRDQNRQVREQMQMAQPGAEIMEKAAVAFKNVQDAGGMEQLEGLV